jgi:protease-4
MIPQPPPGQGPIDPRGAFSPPPPPGQSPGPMMQGPMMPPPPRPMGPMGPPPGMFPPPMYMPPPPRGGGFARGILMTLATTLFGLSLTLNIYLLIVSGMMSGSSRSTSVVEGDPNQKIAIIPLSGAIMGDASEKFDRLLTQIERDKGVKALVVEIDSPGGTVTGSDEIHHRLLRFKSEHANIPVVISMASLAASGGYYVACAGDYVFAQPTTLTGNIGVLMPQYNVSEMFEKWGIKETTIESTGATYKNAGSMFRPEKPEDRAYIQDIADKAFTQFKSVVSTGRQGRLKKPLAEIANGKIYMAADAAALGLIDQVGYLNDACDHAATKAGLNRRTVVKYEEPQSFAEKMLGQSNVGGASAKSVAINGVNIDASAVRELMTPRLMYLWRGQ